MSDEMKASAAAPAPSRRFCISRHTSDSAVTGKAATSLFNWNPNQHSNLTSVLHFSGVELSAPTRVSTNKSNYCEPQHTETRTAARAASPSWQADARHADALCSKFESGLDEEREALCQASDRRTQLGSGRAVKYLVLLHTRR